MAITKKFVINKRLDDRVNYVLNADKTSMENALEYAMNENKTEDEASVFKTAINCNLETAYQDMMDTKKRKRNTGGRLGYHIIQSFAPGEVTAKEAHEIGVEFTEKCFGGKYEAVVGTHIDKAHIHSHIIINSVSFIDGKKHRDSAKNLFYDIRGLSDEICRQHGLSVIIPEKEKKTLTYIEWLAKNHDRVSWQTLIRNDIDDCIKQAFSYGNFQTLMEYKGYEIKQGKYIAFQPMGKERFSRGYKLGHEYSWQNIKNRIEGKDLTLEFRNMEQYMQKKQEFVPFPKGKLKGFRALCMHYMFLLGQVKKNEASDRESNILKEDLIKFETMTKTFNFITDRNLDTVEAVERYKDKCYKTIELLKTDQAKTKKENKEKIPLFKAVTTIRKYEKAYHMYLDGYTMMKTEHDVYLKAFNKLEAAGYKTADEVGTLTTKQSDMADKLSSYGNDIRHFRHEIRMCDKAIELNRHIEEKKQKLKEQNQEHSKRRDLDEHKR